MPPFPWYIFQKNVPPICNSVKSSRNLTRTHYRNYLICKYNRFYQDCKCLRSWGPVGVTEKPHWRYLQCGFSFLLNHNLTTDSFSYYCIARIHPAIPYNTISYASIFISLPQLSRLVSPRYKRVVLPSLTCTSAPSVR